MQLIFLVGAGFTKEEVYELTVRQVLHLARVAAKLKKLERLAEIADMQVASPGADERAFYKHINQLKYE